MENEPEKHDHNDHSAFDGFELEKIEERFKTLAQELKSGKGALSTFVGQDGDEEEEIVEDRTPYFRGYNPTILDYLARASSKDECREIIEFVLSKDEITHEEAEKLQERLELGGARAFGTRDSGYYFSKL